MMKSALALGILCLLTASAQQYLISTIAGGAPPPTPALGIDVSIGTPRGIAMDAVGNIYFTSLNSVFKLDQNGAVMRVAGNSRPGYSGDGGPATAAQLYSPQGVAIDATGNLFINDLF